MSKINIRKVESLLNQIENSAVIQVDDSPYLNSVNIDSIPNGDADNEVLMVNWHDNEGQEFMVKFTEQGLSDANFKDNQIMLLDSEGNDSRIFLLELTPCPVVKNWQDYFIDSKP